jgi:hypothetical protein
MPARVAQKRLSFCRDWAFTAHVNTYKEATMGLTNSFNAVLVGAAFAFVALMLFV